MLAGRCRECHHVVTINPAGALSIRLRREPAIGAAPIAPHDPSPTSRATGSCRAGQGQVSWQRKAGGSASVSRRLRSRARPKRGGTACFIGRELAELNLGSCHRWRAVITHTVPGTSLSAIVCLYAAGLGRSSMVRFPRLWASRSPSCRASMLPSAIRTTASASTGIGTSSIERVPVSRAILSAWR